MRIYMVHLAGNTSASDAEPVLVKEGFSYLAFLFSGFWALWHRMWLVAATIFSIWIILGVIFELFHVSQVFQITVTLAASIIIGFSANDWRSASLSRRGYNFSGLVAGTRSDAALRRWYDLHGFLGT